MEICSSVVVSSSVSIQYVQLSPADDIDAEMKIESKWCWFNQIEKILKLSLGAGARAWTPTRTPGLNKIIVNDRARGQAEGKEKSEFIYFNLKPRHLFDWKLCADPKNRAGTSNESSLVPMKLYTIWYLFMVFKGFSFGTCFACLSSSCSSWRNRIMGHTSASSIMTGAMRHVNRWWQMNRSCNSPQCV